MQIKETAHLGGIKWDIFLFNRAISIYCAALLTTCMHILIQHDFHRGTVAVTREIRCNRIWHIHWNVKRSAFGAQWPKGPCRILVESWLRPMALTPTVRGNKKSYAPISNQPEFHPTQRTRSSDLRNYRIPPFPISPSLDQTVAGFWNNYPKGTTVTFFIAHWASTVPISRR